MDDRLAGSERIQVAYLVEANRRTPPRDQEEHGLAWEYLCLLSTLPFHGLTTHTPFEVWLAIESKAWQPRVDYPPLRIVRFSGAAWESGIEEHSIEGILVKVYSPAKTVADCFKYRNKIGLDVAIEALRDCRRQRKCANDDLVCYARICRVTAVMRPYLEAVQ